jgi:hypothetical protein
VWTGVDQLEGVVQVLAVIKRVHSWIQVDWFSWKFLREFNTEDIRKGVINKKSVKIN